MLVVLEVFCPVLCEARPASASSPGENPAIEAMVADKADASISPDAASSNVEQAVCNDECLCHSTAIPAVTFRSGEIVLIAAKHFSTWSTTDVFRFSPPNNPPPKLS